MITLYTVCAVGGGTVLVLQFILSLIGLGHDGDDGGGFHDAGNAGDFHGDGAALDHGEAGYTDHEHLDAHDSSFFFRLMSFRSVVAALTFFGLGGGLCESAGLPLAFGFLAAIGMGGAAMLTVAWIMNFFITLREEGTVHIQNALGAPARVYLNIPGNGKGAGKVTVTVQNCSMEYLAMTEGEKLATGTPVVITDIVDENTVRVKRDK
jgi:hypothetical protein